MSNREAGKVYEHLVESVINEVREHFENAGIDEQTLSDLRRVWKEKLLESKTTNLTWVSEAEPNVVSELPNNNKSSDLVLPGGELPIGVKTEDGQVEVEVELNTQLTEDLNVGDAEKNAEAKRKQLEKETKRSALLDNDEVGSELDDSDDDYLISENENEGPDENLILCLYDKVTRTKARWKCALKDGIATIDRKDYTFQKAQVEAEWV